MPVTVVGLSDTIGGFVRPDCPTQSADAWEALLVPELVEFRSAKKHYNLRNTTNILAQSRFVRQSDRLARHSWWVCSTQFSASPTQVVGLSCRTKHKNQLVGLSDAVVLAVLKTICCFVLGSPPPGAPGGGSGLTVS